MQNLWTAKQKISLRLILPAGLLFLLACGTLPQTTGTPSTGTCELVNMTASATWEGLGEKLDGSLVITNYTKNTCTFKGIPQIRILDSEGKALDIQQVAPPETPAFKEIELSPDQSMQASIQWTNWCSEDPQKVATSLEITLPDVSGQLSVSITDPNGQPLLMTPLCNQINGPSTLLVFPFQAH